MVVIQPGHEVDHPPQFSVEIENGWSYTSTSPMCLPSMDRDSFTFSSYLFCSLTVQIRGFHHPLRQKNPPFEDFNQNILCILPSCFGILLGNIILYFIMLTLLYKYRNCDAVNGVLEV